LYDTLEKTLKTEVTALVLCSEGFNILNESKRAAPVRFGLGL